MAETNSMWLEEVLTEHLRPVQAPAFDLGRPETCPTRTWIWALAAMVVVSCASAVLLVQRSQRVEFACTSASELQSWVKETAGLDLPLPVRLSPGVQLVGANRVEGGAEIVYTVGGRRQRLRIESAAVSAPLEHRFVERTAKAAVWTMGGQLYRVEYSKPANADAACVLCHAGA